MFTCLLGAQKVLQNGLGERLGGVGHLSYHLKYFQG